MPTALLVTTDLGGNLPPLLAIGRALQGRGWSVVVHADGTAAAAAAAAGLEAVEPKAAARYDARRPRNLAQSLRDVPRLWADRTRGRDAVAAARRIGAHVAVVDVLLVGALAELEAAGVPTVVVAHSSWEGVRTFLGGPLGLRLRALGTPPFPLVARARRVLVATDVRLGRRVALPVNAAVVGPALQEVPRPAAPTAEPPLVLVSLSTVAFPGQRATLQRLLDAVAPLALDVRVGAGAVAPAGLRVGAGTTIEPLLDHGALMPRATAVVSHGGHATTVRALAHGLPLLLVPMHPLMDQPRIARAVAAEGAGLVVPRTASPARMRAALERLLQDPSYAAAARRIGTELVAADGAGRAADEIERVAAGG